MSLQKYQNISLKKAREQGFTIVELLIVIIVIAILAALVISAYTNIQSQARASANKSDARAVANALSAYATANNSTYPTFANLGTTIGTGSSNTIKVDTTNVVAGAATEGHTGYTQCGSGTGAEVRWYDSEASSNQSTLLVKLGTGSCS